MKEIVFFDLVETSNVDGKIQSRVRHLDNLNLVKKVIYRSLNDFLADNDKIQIHINLPGNKCLQFDVTCNDFFIISEEDF